MAREELIQQPIEARVLSILGVNLPRVAAVISSHARQKHCSESICQNIDRGDKVLEEINERRHCWKLVRLLEFIMDITRYHVPAKRHDDPGIAHFRIEDTKQSDRCFYRV